VPFIEDRRGAFAAFGDFSFAFATLQANQGIMASIDHFGVSAIFNTTTILTKSK
jgi:hypothetical protein